jgi:hypothetical protein
MLFPIALCTRYTGVYISRNPLTPFRWHVAFAVVEATNPAEQEFSAKNRAVVHAKESSQYGFHGLSPLVLDSVDNVLGEGQFSPVGGL